MPKDRRQASSLARDRCDAEILAGAVTEEVASAANPFDDQSASEEIALLWTLGPDQVRRRWRTLVGRPMPIWARASADPAHPGLPRAGATLRRPRPGKPSDTSQHS